MNLRRNQSFLPKVFKVGELRRCIAEISAAAFDDESEVKVNITRNLPDNTQVREGERPIEALTDICDLLKQRCSISVSFSDKKDGGLMRFQQKAVLYFTYDSDGGIGIGAEASTSDQLDALTFRVSEILGLEEQKGNTGVWGSLADLDERIQMIEKQRIDSSVLRCFLSFQFKGKSLDYGENVKRFLQLLNVTVITGQGYEPQTIQAKVKKRLADIDLLVAIIVGGEPSDWIRDEMARTQREDTFLIPLVEKGAKPVGGIYGDHEHIEFSEGHISDSFIGLLEGITHIRNLRHEGQAQV